MRGLSCVRLSDVQDTVCMSIPTALHVPLQLYRATRSRTCTSTTDTQTAGGAADGAVVCATDAAVAVAAVRPADATADGAVVRAALHTASSPCGQSMAQ